MSDEWENTSVEGTFVLRPTIKQLAQLPREAVISIEEGELSIVMNSLYSSDLKWTLRLEDSSVIPECMKNVPLPVENTEHGLLDKVCVVNEESEDDTITLWISCLKRFLVCNNVDHLTERTIEDTVTFGFAKFDEHNYCLYFGDFLEDLLSNPHFIPPPPPPSKPSPPPHDDDYQYMWVRPTHHWLWIAVVGVGGLLIGKYWWGRT